MSDISNLVANPTPEPDDLCKVCRGPFSAHKDTIHAFTPLDGDLITKEQAIKRQQAKKEQLPGELEKKFNRLVQVLVQKEVLTDAEAFFVMTGPFSIGKLPATPRGDEL